MARHQHILDRNKGIDFKKESCCKILAYNSIVGAEVIILLKLLESIKRKGRHIEEGSIEVGFSNKKYARKF